MAKWLISNHGDAILRLAGIRGFTKWKAITPETVAPRRLPDGLFELGVPGQTEPHFVLVEIETYPASDVDPQVFEDVLIVRLEKRRLPEVVSFILKPRGQVAVHGHIGESSTLGVTRLAADWRVVRVWELDAEELLTSDDVGLVPFAPLARSSRSPVDLLTACRNRIEQVPDSRDRATLLAVTSVYSDLAFPEQQSFDFYGGLSKMIDSPVWKQMQQAMEEHYYKLWKEEGLAAGRTEGLEKGRQEGRLELLRDEIRNDLTERFGRLAPELVARIGELSDESILRKIWKETQVVSSMEDVFAMLPQQ